MKLDTTSYYYNPSTSKSYTSGTWGEYWPYVGTTNKTLIPLEADRIVVSFMLMDGTVKKLSLKKYMEFCIRNKMMPEDCRDEEEYNKIIDEMRMVEEL